jgi:hypothetical protein
VNKSHKIIQKQIELRDLQLEGDALDDDSRNLATQITFNSGSLEHGKLKRQQDDLFGKMKKIAEQCDRLQTEIWQDLATPELIDLCLILKVIEENFPGKIHRSAQLSLPEIISSSTILLESLVLQIAGLPGEPNEIRPLQKFIGTLMGDSSLDIQYQNHLKNWATKHNVLIIDLSNGLKPEVLEISLMIKVVSLPPSKYMVSAIIVRNLHLWRTQETLPESTLIDLPSAFNSGCTKEQLPDILSELVGICGGKCKIPLSDLTVQWFLPIELMSLNVEHWPITIGRQRPCNGEHLKSVVIRCADRHFFSAYQVVDGEWQKKWRLIAPSTHCHSALEQLDPKSGKVNIDQQQAKVGCHFVEHHDPTEQENFWDKLIGQGLPLAIWVRQSEANKQKSQRVLKSVTNCVVADLPTSLTDYRQKTLPQMAQNPSQVVHLSMLWDNPFLSFPSLDYRSK